MQRAHAADPPGPSGYGIAAAGRPAWAAVRGDRVVAPFAIQNAKIVKCRAWLTVDSGHRE